jgi:molybdopterin-binding protein
MPEPEHRALLTEEGHPRAGLPSVVRPIPSGFPPRPIGGIMGYAEIKIEERLKMRISARNQIKGTVKEVKKGATTAHVLVDIGGHIITSSITNESIDTLNIKPGQSVYVVIKASDVMIGVD